jgi:hypothetical protein
MSECDIEYVQNCVQTVQRGCNAETEGGIVREILRYIPHEEPKRREGFSRMLECARGTQNAPTRESEPIELSESSPREDGFVSMFTASQKRSIDEFPQICTKQCPHTQCSSWGTSAMENQLCRNKVPTNEQIKHSQTRAIDPNTKLKNDHVIPNRPNFCKPKNLNGIDEE